MKKSIIAILFLLSTALPAYASQEAETCLNKLVKTELREFSDSNTKANLMVSVNHEGKNYHRIKLAVGTGIYSNSEVILATDAKGYCEIVLRTMSGPLATKAEYDEILGKAVSDKFLEASRQK